MTDKEKIMIDGCNVLKCRYYQYKTLKDCEMRYPESGDCEIGLLNYLFDGNLDIEKLCKDNPNCYFKQRARKTQECEKYKQTLDELSSLTDLSIAYICFKCKKFEGCEECIVTKIKDIINKIRE